MRKNGFFLQYLMLQKSFHNTASVIFFRIDNIALIFSDMDMNTRFVLRCQFTTKAQGVIAQGERRVGANETTEICIPLVRTDKSLVLGEALITFFLAAAICYFVA